MSNRGLLSVLPTRHRRLHATPQPQLAPLPVPSPTARTALAAQRRRLTGLALTLPMWLLMICVGLVPLGYAVYTSLTSSSLYSNKTAFVGLSNYMSAILHDGFLSALRVTLIVVAAAVVIQFPLGYLLASCLNRRPRGYTGIQTVLLLPLMLTPVAVGEVWLFIFDPSIGVARYFASPVAHNLSLLGTPATALCVIIFVDTWINTPFVMVMILAGMSGLPPDPREAARLDGASSGQLLRFITLPALRPVLLVTLLLRVINAFQVFDIIYVLTLGGPGTSTTSLGLLVYQDTFQFFTTGAGAAVAVAMVIIELPVYIAFTRFTRASFT